MIYIEDHICDDLALSDVSSVTVYSPYHFGRLFYYIAEMPLSEYIRKRKLSMAAMELQNSSIKVIDLAMKYGYESADSFSRAFTKQHGFTPTAARQMGVVLKIYPPFSFQIKLKGVQEMDCRIEEKEAFEIYGLEKIIKNDEMDKISSFWDETAANGSRLKLPEVHGISGYCDCGKDKVPYMIFSFMKDDSDTKGFKVVQIPKLTWAIFRTDKVINHENDNCRIPDLFSYAYSQWLPASGYVKASGPDVEIYGSNFEEIWIPIDKMIN